MDVMLIDTTSDRLRLTRPELLRLRAKAAKQGYAVQNVHTSDEYEDALYLASEQKAVAHDLLEYLRAGSSPLTRGETTFAALCDKETKED